MESTVFMVCSVVEMLNFYPVVIPSFLSALFKLAEVVSGPQVNYGSQDLNKGTLMRY